MKSKLKVLMVVGLIVGCSTIPYKDDVGFLVSAQANSPELPVYLNGKICQDMDGTPGLCSKRIRTTDNLAVHLDPAPYVYDLTISCTSPMVIPGVTVAANQALDLVITQAEIGGLKSFICVGKLFPQDRTQPISAKFDARVVVSDGNYEPREEIQALTTGGKNYLVLGQYARNAWVFDGKSWSLHSKDTQVEVGDFKVAQAYSESFSDRYNYFQFVGPVKP